MTGAGLLIKVIAVLMYAGCLVALPLFTLAGLLLRSARRGKGRVFITARSDSVNWARANFTPIAEADCVDEVIAVVDGPIVEHPRIVPAPPPAWLARICGRAAAKLLWLVVVGLRRPPAAVIGYHIFPSALTALLVARLLGAKSVYQMTGGPIEIEGGGWRLENPLLGRLGAPSPLLEWLTIRLCRSFDLIVALGARGRDYLVTARVPYVRIIAPSIDVQRFASNNRDRGIDVVFVGRVMPVKQPDRILRIVEILRQEFPQVRAALAGNGPLFEPLKTLAGELGVQDNVEFLGHVERVEDLLRDSRVFLLTSRTEGLSIALAEAMAAGAVPVVPAVGDLGELVRNGETGYLVLDADVPASAQHIAGVLRDVDKRQRLSDAARARAIDNNGLDAVAERWNQSLRALASQAG